MATATAATAIISPRAVKRGRGKDIVRVPTVIPEDTTARHLNPADRPN